MGHHRSMVDPRLYVSNVQGAQICPSMLQACTTYRSRKGIVLRHNHGIQYKGQVWRFSFFLELIGQIATSVSPRFSRSARDSLGGRSRKRFYRDGRREFASIMQIPSNTFWTIPQTPNFSHCRSTSLFFFTKNKLMVSHGSSSKN